MSLFMRLKCRCTGAAMEKHAGSICNHLSTFAHDRLAVKVLKRKGNYRRDKQKDKRQNMYKYRKILWVHVAATSSLECAILYVFVISTLHQLLNNYTLASHQLYIGFKSQFYIQFTQAHGV